MSSPGLLAVVCARNEAQQIERCLGWLISQGFEFVLVDHASTDGTRELAEAFLGHGLLRIEQLAWEGHFSLSTQLRCKQRILASVRHDWVAHFDADEAPQASDGWADLRHVVRAADAAGFNCINFDEFVLLPPPQSPDRDSRRPFTGDFRHYYYFRPHHPRLMRLWRRDAGFSNLGAGGHALQGGELRCFPQDQLLKHYIILSRQAALDKYLQRVFSPEDLQRGWHGNRVSIQAEGIESYFAGQTAAGRLFCLPTPESTEVDRSAPQHTHFWAWN